MVGLDICSVQRIRRLCEKHQERFTQRVFTDREADFARRMRDPYPHLAARWAAKEAVFKVLGRIPGFRFTDVEVLRDERGQPHLELSGATWTEAKRRGLIQWHITITHEEDLAACVVLAGPEGKSR